MSDAGFLVGQRVECIDDDFRSRDVPWMRRRPTRGEFYTVRAIDQRGGRGPGLLLADIENPVIPVHRADGTIFHMEPTFLASRFRPATNIDVLLGLLRDRAEVGALQ